MRREPDPNTSLVDAYIYDGIRTPFGRHAGTLASVRPDDLLGDLVAALVDRSPFADADFEDLIAGCANQGGEDSATWGDGPACWRGCRSRWPG